MTPSGGSRKGAGRPKTRPDTVRKHIYISRDVYEWLARNGNASAEIERVGREAMTKEPKPAQ